MKLYLLACERKAAYDLMRRDSKYTFRKYERIRVGLVLYLGGRADFVITKSLDLCKVAPFVP